MSCSASPRDHHPVRIRRRQFSETLDLPGTLPDLEIAVPPPDLSDWRDGNAGVPGVMRFDSGHPGPHVVLVSLIHGNEYAGAIALDRLIREGLTPKSGSVSMVFANLAAFSRFDVTNPIRSRFVEEDMNRLWDAQRLDSGEDSLELRRAREILPVIRSADIVLDLHSMLWESTPLLITPDQPRCRAAALTLTGLSGGTPDLVLTDLGHAGGARLIEHERFRAPSGHALSMLLEAGSHWSEATVETSYRVARHVLAHAAVLLLDATPLLQPCGREAFVTDNVIARSAHFRFLHPWRGGESVARGGTVIARDGDDDICTPYDHCLLVMPNHRPRRGQLAVRLAKRLGDPQGA
ncbi:M14 family metallopeptidase [Acidomonas methanolica]|uniref:succinylglutamate desuccinylase/aspartoacylase domain-containing protein n=1 Tax=Acidomonas methanolica TaxID=437 RepID=UPI002119BEDD|nr:succinylglutamate desuccinylase/aspartoacylase family protein [Acidomonas methanolica]MCQ9154407.1 succinylglutamate desuccinylase/aspartoacylase family protein [Acidomonas methanolica]